jgi:hypothetical protein
MKIDKITKWLAVLASISLIVLPKFISVCDVAGKGSPMRCFFTYQAEFLLALLALIVAISLFFTKETESKKITGFFLFIIGVIILSLPASWVIGLCNHGDSPCHTTAAWTGGASIVLAFNGAIIVWRSGKEN